MRNDGALIWQDAGAYAGYDSRYLFAYIRLHILRSMGGQENG